ncbi:MAG TPA: SAM hydroxide adenosyltransferase, partial [Candidatus Manganitrophaceae bacterium]|nr:SAM hydroxide adenosyltransferase [Candidatus Manganitrophaceae bacterium]
HPVSHPLLRFKPSPTFAGRDHFAPIAAALAEGAPPDAFGKKIQDAFLLNDLIPQRKGAGWIGKIVYLDHFGNAITNLTGEEIRAAAPGRWTLRLRDHLLKGLKENYAEGDQEAGNLIINSSGYLEIFVPNGSAKNRLNLKLLDEVILERI